MKRNARLASVSAVLGLLFSAMGANASVIIDPAQEPNVDNYCQPTGTPAGCSFTEIGRACGTIYIRQRSYTYCCQQITYKCIGNSTTWTTASTSFAQNCGPSATCQDQTAGAPSDPIEPEGD